MFHPYYDPRKLTDNQINDKIAELMKKKSHAYRMGIQSLVDNIDMFLGELYAEQESRQIQAEFEYAEKNNINLTEPITLGEIEEIDTESDTDDKKDD